MFRSPAGTTECRLSGWPGNYSVWCRITATNTLVRWRAGTTADKSGQVRICEWDRWRTPADRCRRIV